MKRKGRANIQVGKPELPPFLKRMKEQIVTNETTIEDKSKRLQKADERDFEDRKDEAPTVVKLKDCDITEEEYKRLKEEAEERMILEGKIKFRPSESKGQGSSKSDTQSTSKAQRREHELKRKLEAQLKAADGPTVKPKTSTSRMLLSFDLDD